MGDIDVTKITKVELEDIVKAHQPTSHLRTKALDELDRRHKLAEAEKTNKILGISKTTLIVAIISAAAAISAVVVGIIVLFKE